MLSAHISGHILVWNAAARRQRNGLPPTRRCSLLSKHRAPFSARLSAARLVFSLVRGDTPCIAGFDVCRTLDPKLHYSAFFVTGRLDGADINGG